MPHSPIYQPIIDRLNREYSQLHTAKEEAFWQSYMGLGDDSKADRRLLDRLETELQGWLQAPERLEEVTGQLQGAAEGLEDDSSFIALQGWHKTLSAHAIDSQEARDLASQIIEAEGLMAEARGSMQLGYRDAEGDFHKASSVRLGVMLGTDPDETLRRAAWNGLRDIETFVLENGFIELVRMRNRLGRMLGGEDYYDWKVSRVEGLSKADIFSRLDELESLTRESSQRGLADLDEAAVTPWNIRFHTEGDLIRQRDPWFPFREGIQRWGQSFAGLGITYDGATMVLDLLDRSGKYENGFMHGPEISWLDGETRHRARIHFTANAIPGMPGSGERALTTLFHEGGHAAHFANVCMPSPCFGQEFAPTSVAFAEIQSMFLDSLTGDPDWQRRYALDASGSPMPVELIEQGIRQVQPHAAWKIRHMMAVCYAERAIYELPEDQLTPDGILNAIRSAERRLVLLEEGSPRPVLSVPHLLSGEASAYYHGYVLAQMGVEQTRNAFMKRDGHLLDNPEIGPSLKTHYWRPGNSKSMDEMLIGLTGQPLGAAALASRVNRSVKQSMEEARSAIEREPKLPRFEGDIELDARMTVIHGRDEVASLESGEFERFAEAFATWIDTQVQEG
ncbi:MAG: M3 family metallopeptidase [Planctomycetota bacterium]|nr:M3 family metallopeptidase [Planctomycetota bacterium]